MTDHAREKDLSSPAPSGEAQKDLRQRSIELLRDTLSMLCNFIWTRQMRPGEHMWSIPVDRERDFYCIFSDAIEELEWRRTLASAQAVSTPGHGWNCLCDVCGPLLSFLNGISPSLLNTPKRNAQGEAVLSIAQSIAIANGDYTSLLDEREEMKERLEASTPAVIAEVEESLRIMAKLFVQLEPLHEYGMSLSAVADKLAVLLPPGDREGR